MDKLLAEVVADKLPQQQCHILKILSDRNWRLLVVIHYIWMVTFGIDGFVNCIKFSRYSAKLSL